MRLGMVLAALAMVAAPALAQVGPSVSRSRGATLGSIKRTIAAQAGSTVYAAGAATASGNAYAAAAGAQPLPAVLAKGQVYFVIFPSANTGAPSLDVGGLGAKPIKLATSAGAVLTMTGGEIAAGPATLYYDGTQFLYQGGSGVVAVKAAVTLTQANFASRDLVYLPAGAQTITLPCSASLSPNGAVPVFSAAGDATLATGPGCGDTITQNAVAAPGAWIAQGRAVTWIVTDGAGHFYVSGNATAVAPLGSPAFTGTPTAPTAPAGAATAQIATTAFVGAATAALPVPACTAFGTASGTCVQGNDARVTGALQAASNLADLASIASARTNLGLGSAAVAATGTSGAAVPLLNGANSWSAQQTFAGPVVVPGDGASGISAGAPGSLGIFVFSSGNAIVLRAGGSTWNFNGGAFYHSNGSGFLLSNGTPSATVPTFQPNRSNSRAGIGGAAGTVSLIADASGTAVEALRATGSVVAVQLPLQLKGYTVSTLPSCSSSLQGARAFVTDASSPTFLGSLTGGGSTVAPALCNGSAWVAG